MGTIQIDSEAIPTNTFVDVDFVPGFNTVGACILDSSVVINSEGRAFLDFIADYFTLDEGPAGSFRILLNATTPDGQIINQFADISVQAIGITPPTGTDGDSTFTLDISVDDMMHGMRYLFSLSSLQLLVLNQVLKLILQYLTLH